MGHPKADIAKQAYAAFAKRDMDRLSELIADDVVWHSGGTASPMAGDYKGRAEVMQMMGRIGEVLDSLEQEMHDITASDHHVVAILTNHVERGGHRASLDAVHIMHIDDDQLTEMWILDADPAKARAFWAS